MIKFRHKTPLRTILIPLMIAALALAVGNAWAAGPVPAASLPGGATVTDSDPGSGESWGRAGGRTVTYEDFLLANFNSLNWQVLSAGLAFDGLINEADGEVMNGPFGVTGGLRWTGVTTIYNFASDSVNSVATRFTILADEAFSDPSPPTGAGIDVLAAAGGDFEVNMLFEVDGGSGWVPALDFFDSYPTAPGSDGDAITSMQSGFYYDAIIDMTVSQHDANSQARFDFIDGVLDFMKIDIINRLKLIAADVTLILDKVMWIHSQIPLLATSAQAVQIIEKVDNLQDFVICLWIGDFMYPACPPDVPPGFELPSILGLTEDVAALHEDLLAQQEIEVTAIRATYPRGPEAVVVLTSLNGVPTDSTVTSVQAITVSGSGIVATPVTFAIAPLSPGVQSVNIRLPAGLVLQIVIEVEHTTADPVTLHGATMIDWPSF